MSNMPCVVQPQRERCTGCGACLAVCSAGAITMVPDKEGFAVPKISTERCTDCKACRAVCPMSKNGFLKNANEPHFYAAQNESEDVLSASTSGGAFTALTDEVLRRGGVIYGVIFDEALNVRHYRAENVSDRDRMRFSKYVQSDMTGIYESIRNDLAEGRTIFFTGTPCQCAGIRAVFGKPAGLYLCDLVCHGVPSPLLWDKYRETLAREHGGKAVTWASFRTKAKGWYRGQYQVYFKVDDEAEQFEDTRFFELYLRGRYVLRPSCHVCPFTDTRRVSDITIADYWGIEKYSNGWADRRGVSLILTGTPKGEKLLLSTKGLRYERRAPIEALSEQKRLSEPVSAPTDRARFWEIFHKSGFSAAAKEILRRHPELRA